MGFVPTPGPSPTFAYVRPNSARRGGHRGRERHREDQRRREGWTEIYAALKDFRGQEVTLSPRMDEAGGRCVRGEDRQGRIRGLRPDDYQFGLFTNRAEGFGVPVKTTVRKEGVGEAITWSLRELTGFMIGTYISIRSLMLGNYDQPVRRPARDGRYRREDGRAEFHGLLLLHGDPQSTMLAVMNFLPLPVVDGGHAVFLIIEKIRGKPLDKADEHHPTRRPGPAGPGVPGPDVPGHRQADRAGRPAAPANVQFSNAKCSIACGAFPRLWPLGIWALSIRELQLASPASSRGPARRRSASSASFWGATENPSPRGSGFPDAPESPARTQSPPGLVAACPRPFSSVH